MKSKKKAPAAPESPSTQMIRTAALDLLQAPILHTKDWNERAVKVLRMVSQRPAPISEMQLRLVKMAANSIAEARAYAKNCAYYHADVCLTRRDAYLQAALMLQDNGL